MREIKEDFLEVIQYVRELKYTAGSKKVYSSSKQVTPLLFAKDTDMKKVCLIKHDVNTNKFFEVPTFNMEYDGINLYTSFTDNHVVSNTLEAKLINITKAYAIEEEEEEDYTDTDTDTKQTKEDTTMTDTNNMGINTDTDTKELLELESDNMEYIEKIFIEKVLLPTGNYSYDVTKYPTKLILLLENTYFKVISLDTKKTVDTLGTIVADKIVYPLLGDNIILENLQSKLDNMLYNDVSSNNLNNNSEVLANKLKLQEQTEKEIKAIYENMISFFELDLKKSMKEWNGTKEIKDMEKAELAEYKVFLSRNAKIILDNSFKVTLNSKNEYSKKTIMKISDRKLALYTYYVTNFTAVYSNINMTFNDMITINKVHATTQKSRIHKLKELSAKDYKDTLKVILEDYNYIVEYKKLLDTKGLTIPTDCKNAIVYHGKSVADINWDRTIIKAVYNAIQKIKLVNYTSKTFNR